MRSVPRARRSLALALAALALGALGIGLDGCVVSPRVYESGPPGGAVGPDDELRRAYDLGYRRGRRDRERRLAADYARYHDDYDRLTERAFVEGYRAGYQGRYPNYEASPGVVAAVPGWALGDFRGWDEFEDQEVALHVERDGQVALFAGGQRHRGVYRSGRIQFARSTWTVREIRGGILLVPDYDPRRSISLRRVR